MLRAGRHKSCGCLKRERITAQSTKHGHKTQTGATATYDSWRNMLRRCENPDHPRYADWGGRGITVCDRWHDFAAFLADMGEKPPGLTLERKDNNGPYSADNCCWDTYRAQRINRWHWLTPEAGQEILQLRAEGLTMDAIGDRMGVSRSAVRRALQRLNGIAGGSRN
jgi:DNA-binding CsgD family transcriptional regulator